ncbi:IS630 family transposase [Streptomyces malaysiensis subsp. malaysiensis]|uniref:IS630 family transposase n=1 Tax=Streptomyces malaysiensis TaxID=92644 RepID=A0ABX6WLR3_STRMQ|nr:IS630 family transposase [Streptomyces solisilvae]
MESPFQVAWNSEERALLEELTRSRTAPLRRVQRARAALACADDHTNAAVARALGVHLDTVRRWRKRFAAEGLAALEDRPRPGRSRRYGPDVHLAIVATVTSGRPATDSQWTHRAIAHHLASTGISASQVGRILANLDLKPHLVRGWLTRPEDPDFYAKAAEVCALYLRCPPHSVVLSVDEKTAMQARSRRHPTRPTRPGQTERREFEYRRHGTASVVAALDVHTGQVLVEDIVRNDSAAVIRFLRMLDQCIDPKLTIHLVLDNGSSHVSKATRAWLAAHPRFAVHHTPKHASWLNQVEIFFSILTRRLLRRGEFTSRQDLIDQIREFALAYDDEARPFRWTYDGTPLKAA